MTNILNIPDFRPEEIIIGMILTIIIVFSNQIPRRYRIFLDSTLGRIISTCIILLLTYYIGWTYGLLSVIAFLVSVSSSPDNINNKEAFHEQINKDTTGNLWFSEEVMKENPMKISTDTIGNSDTQITKDVMDDHLWYSEKIAKERPRVITTDIVKTSVVSDDSQKSMRM